MISRRGGILLTLLAAAALVVAVTAAWRLRPDSSGAGASARAGARSGASDPGDQLRALKWGPLGKLADGGDAGVPVVAFDPVVGTVAVWPSGDVLAYRINPPGGSWDPVQVISASSGARRTQTEAVSVATDSHGTVTIAWLQMEVPQRRVQLMVTTRDSSGRWSQPTALEQATWTSPLEMAPIQDPRLTVGPDGSAAVVWTTWWAVDPDYDESDVIGRARAAYRTKDGHWHCRFNFDVNTGGEDVDIDAHGVATFTVVDANGSPPFRGVELRTLRCVSGRWQAGETIAANGAASDIEVAPDGTTASVVFMRASGDSSGPSVAPGGRVLDNAGTDRATASTLELLQPPPPDNELWRDDHRADLVDGSRTSRHAHARAQRQPAANDRRTVRPARY